MTEPLIAQMEFRWRSRDDLGAIASSFHHRGDFDRWNDRLTGYAAVSSRGWTAAAEARSSAVYLTFPDGMAALILRRRDPAALPLHGAQGHSFHGAGGDRLHLVARALICSARALTPADAIRIAASDVDGLLAQPPGRVASETTLETLRFHSLMSRAVPGEELERRAKRAAGLAPFLAAVLDDPKRAVTVIVPEAGIRAPLHESRALPLLWAAHHVLTPMLTDAAGHLMDGWQQSFSTCEAPLSGGDGRTALAVAFRDRALDAAPLHEGPRPVFPDVRLDPNDVVHIAANLLADAYLAFGDQSVSLIEKVVDGRAERMERINAVACSAAIADALAPAEDRPAQVSVRARQSPAHNQPGPVRVEPRPAPSAHHVPPAQPQAAPRRGDPYLVHLYRLLDEEREASRALRIMDWITARSKTGAGPDTAEYSAILQLVEHGGWFVDRVESLPDGPTRMADLLEPLFAADIGDDGLIEQMRRRSANGTGLPPVIADALGIVAARLKPERADWLARNFLAYALPSESQQPQPQPQPQQPRPQQLPLQADPFGDEVDPDLSRHNPPDNFGRHAEAGVDRRPLVFTVLCLPDELPTNVTRSLVWLSLVLFAAFVIMFLV
ncbi:hypothetical protein E1200_15520 [Actinomadura sp. GC306]|uniref:hypothetical protein n=1 Tax=Actinomadura sp. GC306 TaxID=2530367 RepID=UPI0010430C0E|nr:hypothetical protein [Actinomadura sp. GC306]TDC67152.1 hypothetical protein E1200_15520 [Actinomadura sp. GC306]